ncbi:MAG: hypothetical protein HYV03_00670 [Deltaproteobacteria bacterium]|nr:hypothetical protein [Deltaproteobacteria bacterium]
MAKLVDIVQRESCFQPGSALCPGCMEGMAFQNIGKLTDNGRKTIFTLGTFCGEVSTLQYPTPVAWGRGERTPDDWTKSFGVIHHVFESAPTVAEGIRDMADLLATTGALPGPVQVCALSGDGGALAIGLRPLLHTIARRTRIVIFVMVNEIYANTGFQYSPTTSIGAETSTTPATETVPGNFMPPIDYIGLAVTAGAGLVAQVSPAFPKYFCRVVEAALACSTTAVLFIPSPCITGWKYEDGTTITLARLGCETGFFPCFLKEEGRPGQLKFVELDPGKRPAIEEFMGPQRRFHHLVRKSPETGSFEARPGREQIFSQIRASIQQRLESLTRLTV